MNGLVQEQEDFRPPERSAGVGIWIAQLFDEDASERRGALVVLEVLPGSAAERAGLRGGDRITHVDRTPLAGMTLEEIVIEHLRGPVGSEVQLGVLRRTSEPSLEMRVTREAAPAESGL